MATTRRERRNLAKRGGGLRGRAARGRTGGDQRGTRAGILLGVAGALIASLLVYQVFLKSDDTPTASSAGTPAAATVPAAGQDTTTTTAPLEPELPNGSFDELSLRDPFQPVGSIDTGGDGGTTATTTTTTPDTTDTTLPTTATTTPAQNPPAGTQVALLDVTDIGGGVLQARVRVGTSEYSVKAGEAFANNYKLIQFTSSTCANFTYADSPFSLCTGEQVVK
jgi:hypothetical protein